MSSQAIRECATETLTDTMIRGLREEAGSHGDDLLVAQCTQALEGDAEARQVVASAITAARAQDDDGGAYVPVTAG